VAEVFVISLILVLLVSGDWGVRGNYALRFCAST
jgi:hypothetical protein